MQKLNSNYNNKTPHSRIARLSLIFVSSFIMFLTMAVTLAWADDPPHVDDGFTNQQEYLIGVQYISFDNDVSTTGVYSDVYIGVPELEIDENHSNRADITWASANNVTFHYDQPGERLVTTIVNSTPGSPYVVVYDNLSTQLSALGKGFSLANLNLMEITVANEGKAGDSNANIDFNDVKLNDADLTNSTKTNSYGNTFGTSQTWMVSQFDFTQSFTLTGDLAIDPTRAYSDTDFLSIKIGYLKPNQLTIVKSANVQDGTDFSFTTDALGNFTLDDASPDDSDAFTSTQVFSNIIPGTYFITETVPSDWHLRTISCPTNDSSDESIISLPRAIVQIGLGEQMTCTFYNDKQETITKTGQISIIIDAADGTDFDYTGSLGDFTLDADEGNNEFNKTETFTDLPAGTYTINQVVPDGWTLESIDCGTSPVTLNNPSVTIDLASQESVTCTFKNVQGIVANTGNLTVKVQELLETGQTAIVRDFSFTRGDENFTLTVNDDSKNTYNMTDLSAGTHTVIETDPKGWKLKTVTCVNGSSTDVTDSVVTFTVGDYSATINVQASEQLTCTFTNQRPYNYFPAIMKQG